MADLSFKGGGDVVQYYVMMNLLQNIGFYKDTDKKRRENSNAYYASFNFRSNLNIQISKHLSTGLNFSGVWVIALFPEAAVLPTDFWG